MPAAEHVQRQIAVAVVIAVEEAPLLMPVQRVVGGAEIEDDLRRRLLVRVQEQRHGQRVDRRRLMGDLVIARRLVSAQLQPVQRRLAGHRRTVVAPGCKLARHHRHQHILPQLAEADVLPNLSNAVALQSASFVPRACRRNRCGVGSRHVHRFERLLGASQGGGPLGCERRGCIHMSSTSADS